MNTCTNETKTNEAKPFKQTTIKDYFAMRTAASRVIVGCNFNPVSGEDAASAGISTNEHCDRGLHDCSGQVIDCEDSNENVGTFSFVNSIGERHNLRKRTKVDYTETKISDGEAGKEPNDKRLKNKKYQRSRNKTSKYNGERHASSTNKKDETKKLGAWGRKIGNVKEDSNRRQKVKSGKRTNSCDSRKKGDDEGQNLKGSSKVRKVDSDVDKNGLDKIQTDNAGHQRAGCQKYEHPDCRYTGQGCYKDVCIDDMGDNRKRIEKQLENETEKTAYCNIIETVQNVVNKEKCINEKNYHIDAACDVSKQTGHASAEIMPCNNVETVDILENEVWCSNKKINNFFRVKKTTGCVQKFDATKVQADYISIQKDDDYDVDTYSGINKSLHFYSTCPSSVPVVDFDITDYIDLDNFECIKDETFDIIKTTEGENSVALKRTRNNVMVDDIAVRYNDNNSGSSNTLKDSLDKRTDYCDNLTDLDKGNKDLTCTATDDSSEEFRPQNDRGKGMDEHQKTGCRDGLCDSVMEMLSDICNAAVDEASSLKDINDMCSVEPNNCLLEHTMTEHKTVNDRDICTGDDVGPSEGIDKDHSIIDESASPTEGETSPVLEGASTVLAVKESHLLVGSVVWGRFSKNAWWPALVLDKKLVRKSNKGGFVWLYWLSDKLYSQVKECYVEPFYTKFLSRCRQTSSKKMKKGISLAIEICASRAKVDVSKYGGLDGWVKADDGFLFIDRQLYQPQSTSDEMLPGYVMEDLGLTPRKACNQTVAINGGKTGDGPESIIEEVSIPASDAVNDKKGPVPVGTEQPQQTCNGDDGNRGDVCRRNGYHGDSGESERCLACDTTWEVCNEHPLFLGKICRKCKEVLKSAFYAIDDDGCSMFCCICGEGGNLYVCDDTLCGKAYCFSCVARHSSPTTVKYVKDATCWNCFLCTEYTAFTHGLLVPQKDWALELVKFFQAGQVPLCDDLQYMKTSGKRKLRVLSMFDGIGTGKLVLDELGIDVDVYYASETEPDAILVSSYHHAPVHLGDAWDLDRNKLEALCPIDLVLGGPPCNDLSIVNPARKGFNGTGILVLKFISILKDIEALCKGRSHVFWLLENTGSMLTEYKETICKMLGMEPAVWDAKHFSGQKRARNFWGNIPGMYSTAQYCRQLERDKKDLNSALIANCNRKARVSHSRTITTSRNSLTITNGMNNALVCMNGVEDHIWVQEVERLFGFPTHYTDVGYMSHDRRRKLLGKSWSVPVIKHLLSPLKQYFKVKSGELFGFPTHFTDVGYMSHDRRRKLLGKSWSVPVIKHLLSPLKQYFKVKSGELFGFPTHYTEVGYMSHDRRRKLLGKSWSVPVIKHLLSPLKQYFKVKSGE